MNHSCEDDKTPTKEITTFKFLRKRKPGVEWVCPMVIVPDFEFNLHWLMNTYPFEEACQIINAIKHHFFKLDKRLKK